MSNNTTPLAFLPVRAPTDAELDREWALSILANLPASGEGCETVGQQLAAAQVHATLSLGARVAELTEAVRDNDGISALKQVQRELEGLRIDGIAVSQA